MRTIPLLAAVLALSLTACQETPQETARDVAEARQEGAEQVREAERERDHAASGRRADGRLTSDHADAEYELAETRAKAALDVEQERCEGLQSDIRSACKDTAKAKYDQAIADAERAKALAQRTPPQGRSD